jgi:hypothetical protein
MNYKLVSKTKTLEVTASGVFLCLAYKGSIVGENRRVKLFFLK